MQTPAGHSPTKTAGPQSGVPCPLFSPSCARHVHQAGSAARAFCIPLSHGIPLPIKGGHRSSRNCAGTPVGTPTLAVPRAPAHTDKSVPSTPLPAGKQHLQPRTKSCCALPSTILRLWAAITLCELSPRSNQGPGKCAHVSFRVQVWRASPRQCCRQGPSTRGSRSPCGRPP